MSVTISSPLLGVVGSSLVLLLSACDSGSDDLEESYRTGYKDGYEVGSDSGEKRGYADGYDEGFNDGRGDVLGIQGMIRDATRSPAEYVEGATTPWLVMSWCDATYHCEDQFRADDAASDRLTALKLQYELGLSNEVDLSEVSNESQAYDKGFEDGRKNGEEDWELVGWSGGYDDGYQSSTCASGLPQKFGLSCPDEES